MTTFNPLRNLSSLSPISLTVLQALSRLSLKRLLSASLSTISLPLADDPKPEARRTLNFLGDPGGLKIISTDPALTGEEGTAGVEYPDEDEPPVTFPNLEPSRGCMVGSTDLILILIFPGGGLLVVLILE